MPWGRTVHAARGQYRQRSETPATLPYAENMPPRTDTHPIEIELKLAVQLRDLPRLRRRLAAVGAGETLNVENVYYDTADRLLARHRCGLRVRRIAHRWVQTLKTETGAAALSRRGEWEVPAPRGRLDPARFAQTPLAALLHAHPQARLAPVFRTRFVRTIWLANGGAIEVALDEGEIVAGERRAPILELELELKSGPVETLYRLALDLAGQGAEALALLPAGESKAARGYRLAAGGKPVPVKANARAVVGDPPAGTSLAAALRRVVERGTAVLLANGANCSEADDAEFVHQARVAVRRMRSAARLLGKTAGWPASLERELRWIAGALGAVRDGDVLLSQTLPALLAALPTAAQREVLVDQASRMRQRADAALREALASARFARLALRLLQWAQAPGAARATLASAASKRLTRLHRRLMDSAAFFVALPTAEQHRVRIRAKRLRYGLDLFAAALPKKPTARYVGQLAHLQDELGALNDAVVAAACVRRIGRAARIDVAPAQDGLAAIRQQHALRAEAALAELARLPLPWH